MTSTHRWLADKVQDTRRLVPFPGLRQNPAGVRHERIPKLEEDALRREQEAREAYDRFRLESPRRLTPEEFDRIRALAADIPSLWNAADTPAAICLKALPYPA